MMRRLAACAATLAAAGLIGCNAAPPASQTRQTDPALSAAAAMAAACSGCHSGEVMSLDAFDASGLEAALLAFKNDAEAGAVMNRLARGYTDEEIAEIATFLRPTAGQGETP